jgi:uncharacterized protein YjbI with pentapeptide repeats
VKTVAPGRPIPNSRDMFRRLVMTWGLGGLLALLLVPAAALAGCTDPPAPGVNWQRCVQDGLEFREVDLTGARLRGTSFFRADLTGSDLSEVNAFEAKFVNAMMAGVRLDRAKLSEADFTKADLSKASLVGADLRRARFFSAVLRGADLTDARLGGADLTRADLSGATWRDGTHVCAEGSIGRCN